jgi:hypothetical protein
VDAPIATEVEKRDENFEGDLMTIKGPVKAADFEHQELDTIRPIQQNPVVKPATSAKSNTRKQSVTAPQRRRTISKEKPESKFALPSRPTSLYRDPSVEDYSDLFIENESVFDRRLNIIKVCR